MSPFELAEPATLGQAIELLDPDDPTVRPMAGGTALMLMMKLGVFRPTRIVSLRALQPQLAGITVEKGVLRIGAMAPLKMVEFSELVWQHAPVLTNAMRALSNVRVRNVATVGGHLAHGDPHMDLPPILIALGASVVIAGPKGQRTVPVDDLIVGYFETALARNELITELVVPSQTGRRAAYLKCTTRAAHDWPALGVAVSLEGDGSAIRDARIVVSAATEKAVRLSDAEKTLLGRVIDDSALREAGEAAAAQADTTDDAHGSADYKRALLRVYVGRAIRDALAARPGAAH